MFELSFPPELEFFRDVVKEFVEKEVIPVAEEIDSKEYVPMKLVRRLGELGILSLPAPSEYGGADLGEVGYAIALEEIGKVSNSIATIVGAQIGLVVNPLWIFGTEEQKEKYLVALTSKGKIGAFGLTEPNAGSDAASIQTTAVRDGDEFILNGGKIFTTNAGIADIFIVFAVTDPSRGVRGGITSFIVEKGFPGFKVGVEEKKLGIRGTSTAELIFNNCRVPEENVLGGIGNGFKVALTTLDGGRGTLSACALGQAEGILEKMVHFVRFRGKLDGKTLHNQMIQWRIADTAMEVEASKYLVYQTVSLVDEYYKLLASKKHVSRDFRERLSRKTAIAKAYVSEVATRAMERALQIFGFLGYLEGLGIERMYRDSIITEIYEGTNEIQRWIIARDIIFRGMNEKKED